MCFLQAMDINGDGEVSKYLGIFGQTISKVWTAVSTWVGFVHFYFAMLT